MISAAAIAAQRYQLLDAGWNPVPVSPRDKGCYITGWPTIETSEYHIDNWNRTNSAHTNTAFVTNRDYFAVDADTRDKRLTDRIIGAAFEHLGDTPFIRVGRAPKALLVYQKEAPSSVATSRFKFQGYDGDGLEILSGSKGANGLWSGAVFTAFGTHPETGKSYTWVGAANPLEDTPADAPVATQGQVDAFIETVRGFAPFAVNPNGSAADQDLAFNAEGLVVDGREKLLRNLIYQAARSAVINNEPLDTRSIAGIGWKMFMERASLADGEWSFKDALGKAASTVRRIRNGSIKIDIAIDVAKATAFYFTDDIATSLRALRSSLTQGLCAVRTILWQPEERAYA